MEFKIIILMLCAVFGKSMAQLRCYACSYSSVDSDRSCLTVTDSTLSVDCPYQYCTIFRQEFTDPAGEIASFMRGCDDDPDFLNHDVADDHYRTYYRACTNDLCNIGDGIQSIIGGSLSPNPVQDGDNLLVPGTGGAAHAVKHSLIVLIFLLSIFLIIA